MPVAQCGGDRRGKRGASKSAIVPDGLAGVKRKLRSDESKGAKRGRRGSEWRLPRASACSDDVAGSLAALSVAGKDEDSDLDDRDGPMATADMVAHYGVPATPELHLLPAAGVGAGAGASTTSSATSGAAAGSASATPTLSLLQRDEPLGTFAVHAILGSDLRTLMCAAQPRARTRASLPLPPLVSRTHLDAGPPRCTCTSGQVSTCSGSASSRPGRPSPCVRPLH